MPPTDLSRPSRHSIRLQDYDYSQPGAYFVTLVTYQREHLFGEIVDGEMRPNDAGKILWEVWQSLPGRYPDISLDEAVVMPNHFHGIIIVGAIHELPLRDELPQQDKEASRLARRRMTIPLVMGYLKMNSAKRINILLNRSSIPVWHRNYYEHIVRNDRAYQAIRYYIQANPANWDNDKENS